MLGFGGWQRYREWLGMRRGRWRGGCLRWACRRHGDVGVENMISKMKDRLRESKHKFYHCIMLLIEIPLLDSSAPCNLPKITVDWSPGLQYSPFNADFRNTQPYPRRHEPGVPRCCCRRCSPKLPTHSRSHLFAVKIGHLTFHRNDIKHDTEVRAVVADDYSAL